MSRCHSTIRFAAACLLTVGLAMFGALDAAAQLRDVRTSQLVAVDGTAFEVTSGIVRVAEERRVGSSSDGRTIDLAVVRVRRAGSTGSPSAHIILAGGPRDSGVDQVLGLARQGGALFADLVNGDVVGIDQRGTGRSPPNLSSAALYALPMDQPGSVERWLPIIERVSRGEATRFRTEGIRLEAYNTRESADDVADVCRTLG
jgi:hypothetical protein